MTRMPVELDQAGAELGYVEMEPFATGVFLDRRTVRFHRDVEATVKSTAAHNPREATACAAFMHPAMPLAQAAVAGLDATSPTDQLPVAATAHHLHSIAGIPGKAAAHTLLRQLRRR